MSILHITAHSPGCSGVQVGVTQSQVLVAAKQSPLSPKARALALFTVAQLHGLIFEAARSALARHL
jgi:hypothetical protein